MAGPRRLRRIDVEAGTDTEIPMLGIAWQIEAARAGIAADQHQAEFGREPLRASLDHEGLVRAAQAGEVVQRRYLAVRGLRRLIDTELHGRAGGRRRMRIAALPAPETTLFGNHFHGRSEEHTSELQSLM